MAGWLEHFHKNCSHAVGKIKERSFWVLASFWLSHRPQRACSLTQPCQNTKNPRSAWLQYFFKRSKGDGLPIIRELIF
jgi:hypothetical protein